MISFGIVVHGGVGSPPSWEDGCRRAAARGQAVLARRGSALDAVIEAAVELEDDGRFNAGTGSQFRLDGTTIEMDAAIMSSEGTLGSVAALQRVKNPVLVAREVSKTPHVMLCGDGATEFSRRCGFTEWYKPSQQAREAYDRVRKIIRDGRKDELREPWRTFDLKRYWNFTESAEKVLAPSAELGAGCDTIGAVAIDVDGRLAVANSTGGASPMLRGRVGDSPIVGCGFYAGPAAAIAATGVGEEIIRRQLCRQVYDWISHGDDMARAVERGVTQYPADVPVGLIAISRRGTAQANNRSMAWSECQA